MSVLHKKATGSIGSQPRGRGSRLGFDRADTLTTTMRWMTAGLLAASSLAVSLDASATPIFARQTGQNCMACHAGGQFPELTPYGRLFKLTGFTLGKRTPIPLAVMGVFGSTTNGPATAPTAGAPGHTATDGTPTFYTGSLFFGGKITDNIGMLGQYTWNNYAGDNGARFGGGSDNTDIRYANRIIEGGNDVIFGVSLNNNPGVEDVWNSSQAWGYGIVPGSTGAFNTMLDGGLGSQVAGAGAYVYWNKTIYAELTGYRTGDGIFSFMTQNNGGQQYISGTSPYVRLAATHEWGAQNIEVGYTYFDTDVLGGYGAPSALNSGPYTEYRDNAVDLQYQYLLDPHTVTVEASRINETVNDNTNGISGTDNETKAKASYTYEARYGAALGYYNGTVSSSLGQSTTTAWVPEVFYIPVQNVRIGLQYTMYTEVPPTLNPTTGGNWNPSDFNQTFLYVWAAY
ncbi:MAG: cytochrome C [Betaproteobacteria bacterium]|nr:cytochrome C [Betaproteobacteria bacterium]